MRENSVLRKALTIGADALCIIAGGIFSMLLCHPEASLSDSLARFQAVVPIVLILMFLVGPALKAYRKPISENIACSMLMSIGAFMVSLVISAILLLLIDERQLNIGLYINMGVYGAFLLSVYRLAFLGRSGAVTPGASGRKARRSTIDIGGARIEELLGRETGKPAEQRTAGYVTGNTVLVAGGAGSIGFELCSQLLKMGAKHVVIFDINENKLLETEAELSLLYPRSRFTACVGSTQDRARLREVFGLYRPRAVFHAASYKHVSILEQNPQEALKNNVMGALYMVEMALKHRAERFILLSDDMAHNPTNIMGASMRVAEMLIQRANEWGDTRFSAVRFGSAVGSSSIIRHFKKQIDAGGPVYVPDKLIERFMMTIPEAARLILESGSLSKGGEIFALDMGAPVNLYELARSMIIKSGFRPDKDIAIELTGIQPSEAGSGRERNDNAAKTANERILVLNENENPPITFETEFDKLCQSIDSRDFSSAISKIGVLVPTFRCVRS